MSKIKARLRYFPEAPSEWWLWENGDLYRRSARDRNLPDAWIPSGAMNGCDFLDRMGKLNRTGALVAIIGQYDN